jgi:hypothetical protein
MKITIEINEISQPQTKEIEVRMSFSEIADCTDSEKFYVNGLIPVIEKGLDEIGRAASGTIMTYEQKPAKG